MSRARGKVPAVSGGTGGERCPARQNARGARCATSGVRRDKLVRPAIIVQAIIARTIIQSCSINDSEAQIGLPVVIRLIVASSSLETMSRPGFASSRGLPHTTNFDPLFVISRSTPGTTLQSGQYRWAGP